jgi:hypothetical protein
LSTPRGEDARKVVDLRLIVTRAWWPVSRKVAEVGHVLK